MSRLIRQAIMNSRNQKLNKNSQTRLEKIPDIFRMGLQKKYGRDLRVISPWEPTSRTCCFVDLKVEN